MGPLARLPLVVAAVALLSTAGMTGCSNDDESSDDGRLPAGVAARVGDVVVRESAVRTRMDATFALQGQSIKTLGPPGYPFCVTAKQREARPGETRRDIRRQCRIEFGIAQAQAVDTIVHTEWLAREARKRGITTDREVRQALARNDRFVRRAVKLGAKQEAASRLDRSGIATQARRDALYAKLVAAMPVTESEITAYAGANAQVFLDSEIRTAEILQTTTQRKARDARRQLERQTSWSTVQERYGIRPFSRHWTGTHPVKKSTASTDAFGRSLFSSRPGKLVGPIHTLNGWFLFEVIKIRPPEHTQLTPGARETVVNTIRSKKLDEVLHDRYAQRTLCSSRYKIPEAPHCIEGVDPVAEGS